MTACIPAVFASLKKSHTAKTRICLQTGLNSVREEAGPTALTMVSSIASTILRNRSGHFTMLRRSSSPMIPEDMPFAMLRATIIRVTFYSAQHGVKCLPQKFRRSKSAVRTWRKNTARRNRNAWKKKEWSRSKKSQKTSLTLMQGKAKKQTGLPFANMLFLFP